MSALGHKQTYAPQQPMSALHPIATAKEDTVSASPLKADVGEERMPALGQEQAFRAFGEHLTTQPLMRQQDW
jgi:hypothetical protein